MDIGLKRRTLKLLHRINESRATQLFILTSVLQAIAVIALEVRVFNRNNDTSDKVIIFGMQHVDLSNCLFPSLFRLNNIIEENIVFIVFQIFQMWLCFNAIYNQNTIQIITIAAANFFCAMFGIVQVFEVQKWYRDFRKTCPNQVQIPFDPQYSAFDIPLVITLVLFGSIMALLSWRLYRQFGWNIYKKIGGDIQKQAIYKTYLIYVMLLKLGLFFMLGVALAACVVFRSNLNSKSAPLNQTRFLPKGFFLFHIGVTLLIFINQIIGYRSVKKEMNFGMTLVGIFWVVTFADFCILLYYSIGSVRDSWYFFIIFLGIGSLCTLLLIIYTIFACNNFGKGLKDHLDRRIKEGSTATITGSNAGKRWSIED